MARYYRSIFDELEDMRNYMDNLFHQVVEPGRPALMPPGGTAEGVPALRKELRVDVLEQDSMVVVTADMIPGVTKDDISIDLLDPNTLEIAAERKTEKEEEKEGYYLHERRFGAVRRVIPLPKAVKMEEAKATFKNGVLEIHLKKSAEEKKTKIAIE
ncbi:MAG: Hsp20/alpha crystallin family protein [Methanoregulaceae archaeon]|nr:Hsp20/alpha crystallin family protein [Methanoregulaceae archaeon]